jgi:RNA polymerase sigma factor (TIGR02999 family)
MSEASASDPSANQVTILLEALQRGDKDAAGNLLGQVYQELRKLAARKMSREACPHTLQPTALVHEAWLRLAAGEATWENRSHFFGAAAEAMRRILVDRARHRNALRRGSGQQHLDIAGLEIASPGADDEVLAINEALDTLARHDARKAELVKLRYFTGFTIEQSRRAPRRFRPHREARLALRSGMAFSGDDRRTTIQTPRQMTFLKPTRSPRPRYSKSLLRKAVYIDKRPCCAGSL